MRRLIALILACLLLAGCVTKTIPGEQGSNSNAATDSEKASVDITELLPNEEIDISSISNPKAMNVIENKVYSGLVNSIDGDLYFVENINAVYVSKEYLEELEYNSMSNLYFGYTLAEIDECFSETRYVFTIGEDGNTTVKEFQKYDEAMEKILTNVAVGSGIILASITVSVVSKSAGAYAVSMLFSMMAEKATVEALVEGTLSGVVVGVLEGIKTKDLDSALKAALEAGSKGFVCGAVTGEISGALSGIKALKTLKGITELNGLTLDEAAKIQMDSKWSANTIKQIKSMEEYQVYKKAGLKEINVNGQSLLVKKDIDLNYKSYYGGKEVTNLERMMAGGAPVEAKTGLPYEMHHIGQKNEGTLALLSSAEHRSNASILNSSDSNVSEIERAQFDKLRSDLYKQLAELLTKKK